MTTALTATALVSIALLSAGPDEGAPLVDPSNVVDLSQGVPEEWLETRPFPRKRFDKMVGRKAPPVRGTNWINSEPLTLGKLKGQPVLLYFWAPDCPSCDEIVDELNALHEEYEEEGLVILGICATYGEPAYESSVAKKELAFPVCLDQAGQTSLAYKTDGTPDLFLIDRDGKLLIADFTDEALLPAVASIMAPDEDEKTPSRSP